MNDMTKVIEPKSDQINADDLIAGDMTITITGVKVTPGQEQPVSMQFAGSTKAFRPCKSMCRVMVTAWGPDANAYVGRSLVLYRDPTVKWGGMQVGGIRIRAMSHIASDLTMMLSESKANRKPFRVAVMQAPVQPASPALFTLEQAKAMAEQAAKRGKDAFAEFWNSPEAKTHREDLRPNMAQYQELAAKAESEMAEDPFGLPAPDRPSQAQIDAAMAEAEAATTADRGAA